MLLSWISLLFICLFSHYFDFVEGYLKRGKSLFLLSSARKVHRTDQPGALLNSAYKLRASSSTRLNEPLTAMDLNPTRSAGDEKDYRLLTLDCGLECLLISTRTRCERRGDLEYAKAAAAMSVQVGSFADPEIAGQ